ncbi:MAG: hypothetical protein DCC57_17595 [Chloroflexi bacterium]|nr:MAG: hypothetical protein DCC57_17595 [Chloroflexota bacterium]
MSQIGCGMTLGGLHKSEAYASSGNHRMAISAASRQPDGRRKLPNALFMPFSICLAEGENQTDKWRKIALSHL